MDETFTPSCPDLQCHRRVPVERNVRDADEVMALRAKGLRDDDHDVVLHCDIRAGDGPMLAGNT